MAQKKQPSRGSKTISASLPLDLIDEMYDWCENQRVRVGRSALLRAALKEFMINHPLAVDQPPCPRCADMPADGNEGFDVTMECLDCGRTWKESA